MGGLNQKVLQSSWHNPVQFDNTNVPLSCRDLQQLKFSYRMQCSPHWYCCIAARGIGLPITFTIWLGIISEPVLWFILECLAVFHGVSCLTHFLINHKKNFNVLYTHKKWQSSVAKYEGGKLERKKTVLLWGDSAHGYNNSIFLWSEEDFYLYICTMQSCDGW